MTSWRVFPLEFGNFSSSALDGVMGHAPRSRTAASSLVLPGSRHAATKAAADPGRAESTQEQGGTGYPTTQAPAGPVFYRCTTLWCSVCPGHGAVEAAWHWCIESGLHDNPAAFPLPLDFCKHACRGSFDAHPEAVAKGDTPQHPPDTYLSLRGWGKGLAWVNGFNLGW